VSSAGTMARGDLGPAQAGVPRRLLLLSESAGLAAVVTCLLDPRDRLTRSAWSNEAVERARLAEADLVVLDVARDARAAVFARLRRRYHGPVVVLVERGDKGAGLPPDGARTLLARPFSTDDLRAALSLPPSAPPSAPRAPDLRPPDLRPPDLRPPDLRPPDLRPPDLRPPDLRPPDAGPPVGAPAARPPDARPPRPRRAPPPAGQPPRVDATTAPAALAGKAESLVAPRAGTGEVALLFPSAGDGGHARGHQRDRGHPADRVHPGDLAHPGDRGRLGDLAHPGDRGRLGDRGHPGESGVLSVDGKAFARVAPPRVGAPPPGSTTAGRRPLGVLLADLAHGWRSRRTVRIAAFSALAAVAFMVAFALAAQGRCGPGCDDLTGIAPVTTLPAADAPLAPTTAGKRLPPSTTAATPPGSGARGVPGGVLGSTTSTTRRATSTTRASSGTTRPTTPATKPPTTQPPTTPPPTTAPPTTAPTTTAPPTP
jgi:hypothetical protein